MKATNESYLALIVTMDTLIKSFIVLIYKKHAIRSIRNHDGIEAIVEWSISKENESSAEKKCIFRYAVNMKAKSKILTPYRLMVIPKTIYAYDKWASYDEVHKYLKAEIAMAVAEQFKPENM